jgi:hypothetical protein
MIKKNRKADTVDKEKSKRRYIEEPIELKKTRLLKTCSKNQIPLLN